MTQFPDRLQIYQCVRRYRDLAGQALRAAETLDSEEFRVGYLHLAAAWQSLAIELEQFSVLPHACANGSDSPEFRSFH